MKLDNIYIANQNGSKLDEIQRLSIAYRNKQPVALEGEPGVGKNEAINVLARAFLKPLYRVRCTEEMLARDIIGGDKLSAEKSTNGIATKTEFSPGKLVPAMTEPGLLILDEVNQLTPSVQKALNSALEDYRSIGSLEGQLDTEAKDGFGLFLTYNPDTGIANHDLEIAVRDRCKVIYFDKLPSELKLRIALAKMGKLTWEDIMENGMEVRGVTQPNDNIGFAKYVGESWRDQEGKSIIGEFEPYLFFDRSNFQSLNLNSKNKQELYNAGRAIVNSMEEINTLKSEGTMNVAEKLGLRKIDQIGRLNINLTSPRLTMKVLEDYDFLRQNGYEIGESLSEAVSTIVDYTVPSAERHQSLGENITVSSLVERVLASHGVMNDSMVVEIKDKANDYSKSQIIQDLREKGWDLSIAEKLVGEYLR